VKLRGALIGAGNIAMNGHVPQWAGDPVLAREVEIVAVADLSPANLEAAARALPDARVYKSAEALLATESLDFCDVCTPPFTRRTLIESAAARGIHVLCEKPIAPDVADAEAIAAAVRAAGIVFVPCHQYHHSPQWQAVVRLLPRIGRVHLVEYEVHRTEANPGNPNWAPSWRTDKQLAGGGILFDHGAHIFYQLRSVLGEPAAVQATVRRLSHADYGVEDSAFVVLDYGDRLAEVRLTWAARRRAIRFHFVGEQGEIVGDDQRVAVHAATSEEISFDQGMSRNSSHSEWYAPLMRGFVDRIRRRDASSEPLEEAVHVARVIARAYESSATQRALPLAVAAANPPEVGRALTAVAAAVSNVVDAPVEAGLESDAPAARSRGRTPWLPRLAGLALLLVAGTWALNGVDGSGIKDAIGGMDPWLVLAATVVNLMAVFAMSGRWRALLRPLAPFLTQMDAFRAMLMGFAVSTIVPARAGEVARAEWLARRTGLPRAAIFGSIVLDALVNAVGMFLGIALLPLVVELPGWLHSGIWIAVAVFSAFAVLVFALRPKPGQPTPGAAREPARHMGAAISGFLARARLGLTAVLDSRALLRSLGASLVAWVLEISVVTLTLRAFHLTVPLGVSLLVLMAVNLALVVPFAPPANLGALEVGATLALMESGVPKERALAFALVYHLLQVIPIGFAGLSLASRSLLRTAPAPKTIAS
jgi:glycosyltransferase AglD